MSTTSRAYAHLNRRDAVGLVLLVLVVHIWILAGSPQWLTPTNETPLKSPTFTTRQIVKVASASSTGETKRSAAAARPTAETTPLAAPWVKPPEIEDLSSQLTAPVALPDKTAQAVDLPPYNRSASPSNAIEPTAFAPPPSALLKYQVSGQVRNLNYTASGELLWQAQGETYQARLEIGAFLLGSRVQTSTGTLGAEGLMPTRFGDKTRSELAAHFQRDKGVISFSANTADAPLLRGAQDRLSVVMQISALLAADPQRFPSGTMLSFQTVSQREAEVWQFVVEKPESLELPYGRIASLKVNRQPRREFDQQIEIWYAPELQYLPVRLRITNANGDQVDQQLRHVERQSAP